MVCRKPPKYRVKITKNASRIPILNQDTRPNKLIQFLDDDSISIVPHKWIRSKSRSEIDLYKVSCLPVFTQSVKGM